jgi:hypothetical protein
MIIIIPSLIAFVIGLIAGFDVWIVVLFTIGFALGLGGRLCEP